MQQPDEVAYIPKTPAWVPGPATAGGGATASKGAGRSREPARACTAPPCQETSRMPPEADAKPDEPLRLSQAAAVIPEAWRKRVAHCDRASIHNDRRYREARAWLCVHTGRHRHAHGTRARKLCAHLRCSLLMWHKTCSSGPPTLSTLSACPWSPGYRREAWISADACVPARDAARAWSTRPYGAGKGSKHRQRGMTHCCVRQMR